MKRRLILIGGVPGSGKSTVANLLNQSLSQSAWLDGDWCWMMDPFIVTEENKQMVEDNILHLLNNYIKNEGLQHIIFSWVLHRQDLMDRLLSGLDLREIEVYNYSLICQEDILKERMLEGGREETRIRKSIGDMAAYTKLNTDKVDVSHLTPIQVADEIKMRILKDLFTRG